MRLLNPGCRFNHQQGDPCDAEQLRRTGADTAQAIIIGGLQGVAAKEADALTISLILLLQEVLLQGGRDPARPLHIVGMVSQPTSGMCRRGFWHMSAAFICH